MATIAGVDRPTHPDHPSPSVSSTTDSGSRGSDRSSSPYRLVRTPSYESDDDNDSRFSLIIHRTAEEIHEFMKEQRLLRDKQGDAVSNSISPDSSFSQGNSASAESQDEDMTEEEFFAQFGEEVPDWAKQPLGAAPQDHGAGCGDDLIELGDNDIEAQLSAEITAVPDNGYDDDEIMELSAEAFEAQCGARAAAVPAADEDEEDEAREARLDAEIGAEPVVDHAAVAAKQRAVRRRRKARKDRYRKRRAPGKGGRRGGFKSWVGRKHRAPEVQLDQPDNLTAPTTEDLEAALDAELAGDNLIDLTTEELEAELDAEPAGADLNDLTTEDLEAQLNAELAGDTSAADGASVDRASNAPKVASWEAWTDRSQFQQPKASAALEIREVKLAERRATNNHGPLRQRLGRHQPPPMRTNDALPKVYHRQNPIDWTPLRKAINLTTRVDLNTCYKALGLDSLRGKAIYERLKAYLRVPGNSVNLTNVQPNDAKRTMARIAHRLLVNEGWGMEHFKMPSLSSAVKFIPFETNSTEVFLEFTSLLYKAMKLEEKRKKGRAKTQEMREANAVVQHQAAQNVAATTYQSPRAVARPPPPPPSARTRTPARARAPNPAPPRPRFSTAPNGGVNPVWARLGLLG
ncbi:hypothetical protein KVR01_008456 [Diaporthe batatas]|uniref:uncharacterized protein n=1 Tax=Diaporthe batatas TaxID=748121 RepID=UPI001D03FBAE|nr:uncharacterized protein KVR01_008456 [Diaporthe batatas]KAG8161469.1 hypothetical protein KVR01_008456 [Diaporthe batatas]